MGGRFPIIELRGCIESDLAAKAYTADALDRFLVGGGSAAFPSHLRRVVPAAEAQAKRMAFAQDLAAIRDGHLLRAVNLGKPSRSAAVILVGADAGIVVLAELIGGRPGATTIDLRRQLSGLTACLRQSATARGLQDRLVAVEAGRPDPRAEPPERRRIEIRTPEALAEWRFEAERTPVPADAPSTHHVPDRAPPTGTRPMSILAPHGAAPDRNSIRRERFVKQLRRIQDRCLFLASGRDAEGQRTEAVVQSIDFGEEPALYLRQLDETVGGPAGGGLLKLRCLSALACWRFTLRQGVLPLGELPIQVAEPEAQEVLCTRRGRERPRP
jgi:hypothetical protein